MSDQTPHESLLECWSKLKKRFDKKISNQQFNQLWYNLRKSLFRYINFYQVFSFFVLLLFLLWLMVSKIYLLIFGLQPEDRSIVGYINNQDSFFALLVVMAVIAMLLFLATIRMKESYCYVNQDTKTKVSIVRFVMLSLVLLLLPIITAWFFAWDHTNSWFTLVLSFILSWRLSFLFMRIRKRNIQECKLLYFVLFSSVVTLLVFFVSIALNKILLFLLVELLQLSFVQLVTVIAWLSLMIYSLFNLLWVMPCSLVLFLLVDERLNKQMKQARQRAHNAKAPSEQPELGITHFRKKIEQLIIVALAIIVFVSMLLVFLMWYLDHMILPFFLKGL